MGGGGKRGKGRGGLDGAALAGFIKREVLGLAIPDTLDELDPNWEPRPVWPRIITARYAVRAVPCICKLPCCSGWRSNNDWLIAVADIAELAISGALSGCRVNFNLRHAIVRRYFGERRSLVEAAKLAEVDRHTASAHANRVITYLKDEERKARYAIEARLKVAGIVE